MSCPHSSRSDASPATCSLCRGATPHRIDNDGPALLVDGKHIARDVTPSNEPAQKLNARQRRSAAKEA